MNQPIYWNYQYHCFRDAISSNKDPLLNLEFFDFIYAVERIIKKNEHQSEFLFKLEDAINGMAASIKQFKRNVDMILKDLNNCIPMMSEDIENSNSLKKIMEFIFHDNKDRF